MWWEEDGCGWGWVGLCGCFWNRVSNCAASKRLVKLQYVVLYVVFVTHSLFVFIWILNEDTTSLLNTELNSNDKTEDNELLKLSLMIVSMFMMMMMPQMVMNVKTLLKTLMVMSGWWWQCLSIKVNGAIWRWRMKWWFLLNMLDKFMNTKYQTWRRRLVVDLHQRRGWNHKGCFNSLNHTICRQLASFVFNPHRILQSRVCMKKALWFCSCVG